MIRIVAALFLIAAPMVAVAQTVQIRSGEHDGYSRLVFDFDKRVAWSVRKTPSGAELTFPNDRLRFDSRTVFDRISRGRIKDLVFSDQGNAVTFDLACDCEVEGFWHGAAMLVVDVSGRENNNVQTPDRPVTSQGGADNAPPPELPIRANVNAASLSVNIVDEIASGRNILDMALPSSEAINEQPGLESARDELLLQFGRAASQGLLTPTAPLPSVKEIESKPKDTSTTGLQQAINDSDGQTLSRSNIQIRARSSIDSAFADRLNSQELAQVEAASCLDAVLIDIESWGSDAPFWEQISQKRSALTGEFDRVSEDAVLALARLYVHFGFGREAQQVLALAPVDNLAHKTVIALAEIMDHEHARRFSPLHMQFDCKEGAALWSVLAHETLPPGQRLDTDWIITAFSALPKHLRSHLGPILAARFLDAGLNEASARVLRILNRTKSTKTARSELALAQTERVSGLDDAADTRLENLIKSNSESAVDALVAKVESLVRRQKPVSYDIAQLAGSYAFEHRNAADAEALQRIHALALAASGAFDEAYTKLETLDSEQADLLKPTIAEILTREAADTVFLKHVLAGRVGALQALKPQVSFNMARRLLEAGFVDAAAATMAGTRTRPTSREARMLSAEISLAQGLPRKAEVDLLGLDGRDVNVLRARARSLAGEHGQAYELYQSAGLLEDAEREAWLSIVPGSSTEAVDSENANQILARNRDLLDASSFARSELETLLSENPFPTLED